MISFVVWNVQSLNQRKSLLAVEYFLENNVFAASLTETWFKDDDNYQTALFKNVGNFSVFNRPRVTDTTGGGVCVLMKVGVNTTQLKKNDSTLHLNQFRHYLVFRICLVRKLKLYPFTEEIELVLADLLMNFHPLFVIFPFPNIHLSLLETSTHI